MANAERFVFLTDLHWGYERKNRHKSPLHDMRALKVALNFVKDFKPDHIILGGDMLDCGAVSHHNRNKPGVVEGFRLIGDARELKTALIDPLEAMNAKSYTYITGNHEDWLADLTDQIPALEGVVDIDRLLDLGKRWKVVPQGGLHKLGKLVFVHGDQIKGGEHSAKAAVVAFEKSIRFGHHHTHQTYTKVAAVDAHGHTGIAVPCLCRKDPQYGEGNPNRWSQGFLYGWANGPQGMFSDYVATIINGKSFINGKLYTG